MDTDSFWLYLLLNQVGRSCFLHQCDEASDHIIHQKGNHLSYGVLNNIIIDNKLNLNNKVMDELHDSFKIKYHNSSPYKPKMNGAVEATNKNIKKII